jgi:WD40 repeat protein
MERISTANLGEAVHRIVVNPRYPSLLTIGHPSRRATLWEWDQNDRLVRVGDWGGPEGDSVFGVAYHPDGNLFALSYLRRPIELRRHPDGALIRKLGQAPGYGIVSISPDGESLVAACSYPYHHHEGNRAEVYSLGTDELQGWFAESDTDFAWHSGQAVLATATHHQGGDGVHFATLRPQVRLFDLTWLTALRLHGMRFSPDGRSLVLVGEIDGLALELIRFPSCELVFRKAFRSLPRSHNVQLLTHQAVFSPDGSAIICPYPTGDLAVLDARTGSEARRWHAHDAPATAIDIRHDLKLCATGGQDGSLVLWHFEESEISVPRPDDGSGGVDEPIENLGFAHSTDRIQNVLYDFDEEPTGEAL